MEDERLRAIGKPALLNKSDHAEENKVNHVMRLAPSPFEMIEAGTKTIELRLFDEKRRNLHVGDVIEFIHTENSSKTLLVKVVDLFVFDSFMTLYENLPLLECGYMEKDIDTASPDDMDAYYSKAEQEKYGVVGIIIALL